MALTTTENICKHENKLKTQKTRCKYNKPNQIEKTLVNSKILQVAQKKQDYVTKQSFIKTAEQVFAMVVA